MSKKELTHLQNFQVENSWCKLKTFTDARIGLGRAGISIPTKQLLEFQMDHANARDAVHIPLDITKLSSELPQKYGVLVLESMAQDRPVYLQKPDLGRRLSTASVSEIDRYLEQSQQDRFSVAVVIADGLSSTAVQKHASQLVKLLCNALERKGCCIAPISIVSQGRVAVGDEIGELLGADLLVLMVGERPGLSSPDSLGVYYTYKPKVGLQDVSRNCISNVRPAGLSFQAAIDKLIWLIDESIRIKQSGVMLKDESEAIDEITDARDKVFLFS